MYSIIRISYLFVDIHLILILYIPYSLLIPKIYTLSLYSTIQCLCMLYTRINNCLFSICILYLIGILENITVNSNYVTYIYIR